MKTPAGGDDSFTRFRETMRALLVGPKKEIEEQAAKWKRRKDKSKEAPPGHIAT